MSLTEIIYRIGLGERAIRPPPVDAEAALLRLIEGNRVFAKLANASSDDDGAAQYVVEIDPLQSGGQPDEQGLVKQRPFAAVVGCSDARVPIELIFSAGTNDLFVVRIAGNGLGFDVLGSLKYAIDHLSDLRLLVVLGHSGCGALSAAVDGYLDPAGYLSLASNYALRGILDRHLVAVQASARRLRQEYGEGIVAHPQFREALVETSIVMNAAAGAYTIQQELNGQGLTHLRALYGVYLIQTCEVWALGEDMKLAEPPADPTFFAAFAQGVAASPRIAALLR